MKQFFALLLILNCGQTFVFAQEDSSKTGWVKDGVSVYFDSSPSPTNLTYSEFEQYAKTPSQINDNMVFVKSTGGFRQTYSASFLTPGIGVSYSARKNSAKQNSSVGVRIGALFDFSRTSGFTESGTEMYSVPMDSVVGDYYFQGLSNRGTLSGNVQFIYGYSLKRFKFYGGVGFDVGYSVLNQYQYYYPSDTATVILNQDPQVVSMKKRIKGQPVVYSRLHIPIGLEFQVFKKMKVFTQTGFMVGMEYVVDRNTYIYPRLSPLVIGVKFSQLY
jgi:hypothetical protein